MVVSPETVLFAIKALARLGTAARKSYEDAVIGRDIALPGLDLEPLGAAERAAERFDNALIQDEISLPGNRLAELRSDVDLIIESGGTDEDRFLAGNRLIRLSKQFYPKYRLDTRGTGIWIVQQWGGKGAPATPIARMGLALVDVGLEYLAVNPGAIGLGGNADKLIAGVAENLRDLLPDPDNMAGFGNEFAEGAIRIFVQASLIALEQQVDNIVEKESVRELSKAVLKPLIEKVAAGDSGTDKWYDIRDELLGPISEAAIGVLAKHQGELLGKSFHPETGIGAVTNSILLAIKENGIDDDLGREGMLRIYRAALDVAIAQPNLFVGEIVINGKQTNIGQVLLSDSAKLLKEQSPPFTRDLVIELVAASIDSVGQNAPVLFVYDGDWGKLSTAAAQTIIREVSAGLAAGVRGKKADILGRIFNKEQANKFFKIFIDQVAANPGMIVGSESSPELRILTTIIARAMADQNNLLLSSNDWLFVAAAVSKEVALNPNRLIRLDTKVPESQLAYKVISKLLQEAAVDFERVGRNGGSLLFGETLAEVIADSLEAASGNAAKALENSTALGELTERLNRLNRAHPGRIGRREWRFLFRRFVADVLDTGQLPEYSDEQLLELLENV